mmetsp:Transcript_8600/g.24923  ORF Transcript_8600/g.24923 Transcript_8600/m.24923 type:complete len:239 (-) Transcript_8600:524-1240(-)
MRRSLGATHSQGPPQRASHLRSLPEAALELSRAALPPLRSLARRRRRPDLPGRDAASPRSAPRPVLAAAAAAGSGLRLAGDDLARLHERPAEDVAAPPERRRLHRGVALVEADPPVAVVGRRLGDERAARLQQRGAKVRHAARLCEDDGVRDGADDARPQPLVPRRDAPAEPLRLRRSARARDGVETGVVAHRGGLAEHDELLAKSGRQRGGAARRLQLRATAAAGQLARDLRVLEKV